MYRSRRRNRLENALYWLSLRPWRCEECNSRFFRVQLWPRNGLPKEKRQHERSRWNRLPVPHRIQIVGYGLGTLITLAFLSWLATGGVE